MDSVEKLSNIDLIDGLVAPKSTEMNKEASEGADDYLRMRLYEKGSFRKMMPVKKATEDMLDAQVDTDLPVIICEKEPNAEAAYTVPFATLPIGAYIKGPKFRIMFDRIMSRRHRIDVDKLLTYKMDIKKIFEDILLNKIQDEEDRKWYSLVNYVVTQGQTDFNAVYDDKYQDFGSQNSLIGARQNVTFEGMDRDNLVEATKALPTTYNALNPAISVVNNLTVREICKFTRDEIGGDLAEELFTKGFTEREIMGMKWVVTIKKHLVRTGTMYQFADAKFLGKAFALRDVTLSTKNEDMWLEFYAWESLGGAIGNAAAVACVHFNGTGANTNNRNKTKGSFELTAGDVVA